MATELTAEIATAAARLVAEEGMEYGPAKRKAARQLGRAQPRAGELPTNEAVEDEVRAYLQLYCADTQPAELAVLRQIALRWMERLAAHRPHLSGAVWRGTATRLSAVHIDLYCDDAKAAEIEMINRRIDYDVGSMPGRPGGDPVQVLTVAERCPEFGVPVTLHLAVRDLDDLRGALKADAGGRTWRGDAAGLQRLLAAGASRVDDGGAA
jgi:hypothetical protein